jgi:hypothetical protein
MNSPWRRSARLFALAVVQLIIAGAALANFPTPRTNVRMAYHETLARIVLFGGVTDPDSSGERYELNDTWEWDGRKWVQIFTQNAPSPRSGPAMVYDPEREQIVLFGGISDGTYLNDTWVYRNRNWVELDTPSDPPGRTLGALAYDPVRDRVILHGGVDADGPRSDTWEFDGTTWTQVTGSGPAVLGASLAYDEARNELLLLGMNETDGDTEMYRLVSGSWQAVTPEDLPACVNLGSMVYQRHNQRVLFVGGQCANGGFDDLSFEWDGNNWTDLEPDSTQGILSGFGLAYDQARRETVLFGGFDFGVSGATFVFRNGSWDLVLGSFTPGPRSLAVFEYDPVNKVHWLFGGRNNNGSYSELWKFSGGTWQLVFAENAPTAACVDPAGAWDTERNRLVVICSDSSTFEWNGESWTSFSSLTERPPARRWSSAIFDPRSRETLLFGGYTFGNDYLNELWSWNGTRWTRIRSDRSPGRRALATIFRDVSTNRILLFGGIGRNSQTDSHRRYGDMWEWTGQNWNELRPGTLPGARYGAQAEWNAATQTAVLFGGKSDQEVYLGDTWEWTGSAWRQLGPDVAPQVRMNFGLTFDEAAEKLVLFGGYAGPYYSDLWQFDGSQWRVRQQPPTGRRRGATATDRPTSGSAFDTISRSH